MKAAFLATLLTLATAVSAVPQYTKPGKPEKLPPKGFVYPKGRELFIDGKTFYFGGTNTYYLYYAAKQDIDALFADAKKLNVKVLRTWLFAEAARDYYWDKSEFSPVTPDTQEIVWFQRFNNNTKKIEYNDSTHTGLGRFDYVLESAKRHGIKIIPVFTNNWNNFGGIDWYLQSFNQSGHPVKWHTDFYTYKPVKDAYKNWVSHVINRKSKITGKKYKEDPTVFAWELANEPRCMGWGTPWSTPEPGLCDSGKNAKVIINWADEMSTYIKTLDPHHMVMVGDEGQFNRPNGPGYNMVWDDVWNGASGVDTEAFLRLKNIDVGTFHSYFDYSWVNDAYKYVEKGNAPGADLDPIFSNNTATWIKEHAAVGKKVGKPVIFEEIGVEYRVGTPGYNLTTDTRRVKNMPIFNKLVEDLGLAGSMYWQLNSKWVRSPDGWYNGTDYHAIFAHPVREQDKYANIIMGNHNKRMWAKNSKKN
ncbi:hypothetical protein HK097_007788 [Rhizophlyctis rosea]|uniref:mannan endo-1,4-beta-mannosidase n=1 Tax=Rhizophlyctis rosea TaxID=64517 RepID=A0AAD5SLK3_9FUNG|nr:hypothetical protein HK097_007788 [Rhizophlyctis rosea]